MSKEIIYDHYKNTFENIKVKLKLRDKLSLYLFTLLFIVFLILISPSLYTEVIQNLAKKHLELIPNPNHFLFVDLLILSGILILTTKYYQTLIYIDREYSYIQSIETALGKEINEFTISREGSSYLKERPLLQKYSKWVFSYLFILLLLSATCIYWYRIFTYPNANLLTKGFSILIATLILSYTLLYIYWSISKR